MRTLKLVRIPNLHAVVLAIFLLVILKFVFHRHGFAARVPAFFQEPQMPEMLRRWPKRQNEQHTYSQDDIHFGRPAESPYSGRRFIAGVITMQNTLEERLALFKDNWVKVWPQLHVKVKLSFLQDPSLQGYGVLSNIFELLVEALLYGGEFDYLLVFEDDAIPHENTTWPCKNRPNDLDSRLDLLEEMNGGGLLLGGHTVKGYDQSVLTQVLRKGWGIIRVHKTFGCFGMAIPKRHLELLANHYEDNLRRKTDRRFTPDNENWEIWKNSGVGGYISIPLLVDHNGSSFSYTWGYKKPRPWEGKRNWWQKV